MAVQDDPKTLGRARLTFARESDIDEFADRLAKFESGEITADQWRAFRLLRGTYGQRQNEDAQMLRVKIPQGILTADQLLALADVADRYSRGFGHITTRQNIQFHFVKLHDAELAMRDLLQAGITTREACGNSVRNITGCAFAGISATEPFDITPYAEALTRYFLGHRLSASLPRKFKIGFEGCAEDHVKATTNDIAWLGRIQNGRRGFRVLVGGGTSTMPVSAMLLYEFLPVEDAFGVAEAVVRVFHKLGDYKHKARNRMKFLIKALGWERWHQEFEQALAEVQAEGGVAMPAHLRAIEPEAAPVWDRPAPPSLDEIAARVTTGEVRGPGLRPEPQPSLAPDAEAFRRWATTNLRPQKQPGYAAAIATVQLGDLTSQQFRVLSDLALAYSDGTVRVTPTQDLVFRWVRENEAEALYARLGAAGLGLGDADTIADVTSCPGAESCKLAVTQSRGLGRLLEEYVRLNPRLIEIAPSLDVKVSGCPNGCGQHHIAAVGFQGSLRKLDGRPVPQYFVMVGGGVSREGATFGRLVAKIPARRGPAALERLADFYAASKQDGETAAAFFNRVNVVDVKKLLADLEPLTAETATEQDFIDLAESHAFAPETMEGECAS
jgi:sulfite reductase (NADPH) hemoprotein beta-component